MTLTQEHVRELFDYHEDGYLIWKSKKSYHKCRFGTRAGSLNKIHKRHFVSIDNILYAVSHVVFIWHHGWLPEKVDHIDVDSLNDRIGNLRPATHSDNVRNIKRPPHNTSGFKGVHFNRFGNRSKPWRASIRVNRKTLHLGYYSTPEAAHAAYCMSAKKYFGEFFNPG
jgi:hypothetical protein